ncbi:hypothetical protein PVK06_044053 [Gossypium arboreum]|uniref:RecA family profile 2 domain-containing protein n=1 Tax=Gossypium arboreum TaxID=29729 RepID=A0ABR0MQ50_GOSAR|nr:hypothetical protein PVK06_044053 [Gossypium arboreum]
MWVTKTLKSVFNGINMILSSSIRVLWSILSPIYFQFLLDKLASSVGPPVLHEYFQMQADIRNWTLTISGSVYIVRSKISTFGFGGPTEVTYGGNALKFYASVHLNIRRTGLVKKGEETIGSQVLVKVVKNKLAPSFKKAEF